MADSWLDTAIKWCFIVSVGSVSLISILALARHMFRPL